MGREEVGVGMVLDWNEEKRVVEERRAVEEIRDEENPVEDMTVLLPFIEVALEPDNVEERINVKFATVVPTAASVNAETCRVVLSPAGFVTTKVEDLRRAAMELAD